MAEPLATTTNRREPTSTRVHVLPPLLIASGLGAALSLSLGVYGRVHDPTGETITTFGFADLISMKAWLTTVAALLGLVQAITAAWMFGRLDPLESAPGWVSTSHRWTGTVAFVISLPVAYHCLWTLGFQSGTSRVLAHSVLGCAFYGAIATKLLMLRMPRLPPFALPMVGAALVAVLTGIWLTSSLWFFTTIGSTGL